MNKICSKCKANKDISEFYFFDRGRKSPYSSSCKECISKYHKESNERLKVPCPVCGLMISKKSKLCRSCYHKSEHGIINHKKVSEYRKSLKKERHCVDCNVKIYRQSIRCNYCKSKGEKNPKWNGGVSSLNKSIRSLFEYRQWRSDVFTRDNFSCCVCGKNKCFIHAHHIKSLSSIIEDNSIVTQPEAVCCNELWNINNGITVCVDCHKKLHSTKGNKK